MTGGHPRPSRLSDVERPEKASPASRRSPGEGRPGRAASRLPHHLPETRRFIIPKGWPIKGRKHHRAAAIEAQEEAGLIGRVQKKAIGSYTYWKLRPDHFDHCRVEVFILDVRHQLPDWKEKGQRQGAWLLVDDAADLVDDPGLVDIIRTLPNRLAAKGKRFGLRPATKR